HGDAVAGHLAPLRIARRADVGDLLGVEVAERAGAEVGRPAVARRVDGEAVRVARRIELGALLVLAGDAVDADEGLGGAVVVGAGRGGGGAAVPAGEAERAANGVVGERVRGPHDALVILAVELLLEAVAARLALHVGEVVGGAVAVAVGLDEAVAAG